jgi:hypothetical protein
MTETPEYRTWRRIKVRCFNPKSDKFQYYGGQGITMHESWVRSFEAFYEHVGRCPGHGYSLDRIDNSGNYEPGNVRWATRHEQMNNRSDNNFLEIDGVVHTLADWARLAGIGERSIWARLKRGWSARDAVWKPRQKTWSRHRVVTGHASPVATRP